MGDMRNANLVLVRNPESKRPPGRSRYGWEDNIQVELKERRWKCAD
jgi:hypothetical protein